MLRHSLKSAWQHKRRLISTVVAVVLGVAFMSGTLVLSDTLDRSFDEAFGEVLADTDAEVRGPALIDTGFGVLRAPVDDALIEVIADVEGVAAVGPYVEFAGARVLDTEGEPIGMDNGPPTLLQSWIDDEGLSGGVNLVDGRAPEGDDEMAINVRAADEAGIGVGEQMRVFTGEGTRSFTLVGIFRFRDQDSVLGAVTASFTLPVAQELAGTPGEVTSISARTDDDISQEELVSRIEAALPAGNELEVFTGEEMAQEISDDVSAGLGFFSTLLLVFAFIALLVGAFIIFNTFSILVAQRGKELALMRAIGATRRQVLVSVLVEAILIGLVAALIGLGAGIALAIGVQELLTAIGLDLPTAGTSITRGAVITALITGVVVTLGSALVPAWRATRVPPLAALRDVAHEGTSRSLVRIGIGAVLLVLAVVTALPAFGDDPDSGAIQSVGLAAICLLLGLLVLGPVIVRPLALGIGAFLPLVRGTTGSLARQNAARSPKRTAATAAALMIGVALIVFINVFTTSARASIDAEVTRGLRAEFIVQSSGFGLGTPLSFAEEVAQLDGVDTVSSIQGWFVQVERADGSTTDTFIAAIDPETHPRVVEASMAEGELTDLVPGTILYDRRVARDQGIEIGDEVQLTFVSGEQASFTVSAIGDDPQLLGTRVITQEDWATYTTTPTDQQVFIRAADGADLEAVRAQIDQVAEDYPAISVQDQDEFLGSIADTLNIILNIVYGLLALSVIIALIGIANTLSLSIHERTRELGLLRAVGMTRSQVRSAVRWEALIISLIGTALGLLIGLVTSYVLVESLKSEGLTQFELPVTALVIVGVVFAALGVMASLLPARRAAKLNVLEAIATE